jgi:hypothetical protein
LKLRKLMSCALAASICLSVAGSVEARSYGYHSTGDVWVHGYWRNGSYVQGHYRSHPNGNPYDNWSFPGNTNPYTGVTATGNPDTYLRDHGYSVGSGVGLGLGADNGITSVTPSSILPPVSSTTDSSNITGPSTNTAATSSWSLPSVTLPSSSFSKAFIAYSHKTDSSHMSADELNAANTLKAFLQQNYGISPDDVSDFSLSDLVDLSMRASIAKPMMDNFKVPESELEGLSAADLYNLYPKVVASYFIFMKSGQAYNPKEYTYDQLKSILDQTINN